MAMSNVSTITLDAQTIDLVDVIAAARNGDELADQSLRHAALELLSAGKPLPPVLVGYVMEIIAGLR
jgi:hypothetical protein